MTSARYGKQIAAALFVGAVCCLASPVFAQGAGAQGNAGITVHIDPQTGAILKEPAPGTVPLQLTPSDRNAMSTSHEGLVEVPNTAPGGGVKVDLQGRFRSPLIATVGPDGKVRVLHLGEPADHPH